MVAARQNPRALTLAVALIWGAVHPVLAGAPLVSLIPQPRPVPSLDIAKAIAEVQAQDPAVWVSLIPRPRPETLKLAYARQPEAKPKLTFQRKGSVCGIRAIRGATLDRFSAKTPGCGISEPVRVTSVAGVTLSTPATIDCTTAKALHSWVVKTAEPTFRRHGGGLAGLRIAASYSCRTRNSQKGAKISEHAKGHAVDISGFTLKDGSTVTVLKDWGGRRYGRALKRARKSACGTFGTVLGPGSDRFHRDHFHFDTARYRSGAYCR